MNPKKRQLAKIIDHTALKADQGEKKIKELCTEAIQYGFYSVCVNPVFVKYAADQLKNSAVKLCSVVGFPLGMNNSKIKALEAKQAILEGADEIDMVINVGALKEERYEFVANDIRSVVENAEDKLVKVILETCYLTEKEIVKACEIAMKAGANFVKTSTGFGSGGAEVRHIRLMRKTVGKDLGVKASGGIRTYEDAVKMIEAGASRIGASSSVKIIS